MNNLNNNLVCEPWIDTDFSDEELDEPLRSL